MSKKKVIKGWAAKDTQIKDILYKAWDNYWVLEPIDFLKGKQRHFDPEDWPPKRVTITIEVDE